LSYAVVALGGLASISTVRVPTNTN
jgi:hypothetical protein